MHQEDRLESIAELTKLQESVTTVIEKGFRSPEYEKWHAAAVNVLRNSIGERHQYFSQFSNLQFEMPQRVIDVVIKSFQKIWFITQDQDSNVTRILTPNIPAVAPQNHFKRVMYEASEILLCVVLELRQK
jgi:hypothetical protein